MLPVPRTALIVVGEPPALPENSCTDYRFVDYLSAETTEDCQQKLISGWCYLYDNLLFIFPLTINANDLSMTEAQRVSLNTARNKARLMLPFRWRRLQCPYPGAGFGLTLLRALWHLNNAYLPLDVALRRIQSEMIHTQVYQCLLSPGKKELATCSILTRWQQRLKPNALQRHFNGRNATNWKRVKAEAAVKTLFDEAHHLLMTTEAEGALWSIGYPGNQADLIQNSAFQSLVERIHHRGGLVRFVREDRSDQYSIAWSPGLEGNG